VLVSAQTRIAQAHTVRIVPSSRGMTPARSQLTLRTCHGYYDHYTA
jgi:hypothetical protein